MIAACHIDEETIKQLDDKILNAYNMFPLLCMMYAASESNPGVRFFDIPSSPWRPERTLRFEGRFTSPKSSNTSLKTSSNF
jgi:hypothetical protein